MFCPKCGKSDQSPETYCRQCGNYQNDFDKPAKKTTTPEQHLTANTVLSLMTAITSLTLAISLYAIFLGKTGYANDYLHYGGISDGDDGLANSNFLAVNSAPKTFQKAKT